MTILPRSNKLGVLNPSHHSAFLSSQQVEEFCHKDKKALSDFWLHPGEVALMHNWLVHCSGTNATRRPRRALSVSWMDARSQLRSEEFGKFKGGELTATGYPEGGTRFPIVFAAAIPNSNQPPASASTPPPPPSA